MAVNFSKIHICLLLTSILYWPISAVAITITVTTLDDTSTVDGQVSLREAIEAANTDTAVDGSFAGSGADTIRFAPGLGGGTITLSGTQLPKILESLTVTAMDVGGMTIDANHQSRILQTVAGTVVELAGLTLTNGSNPADWQLQWHGGAVLNDGTMFINHCAIINNETTYGFGGGVYNGRDARMTIHNSTISGNSAENVGGGIAAGSGFGRLTIVNSTITNNRADSDNNDEPGTVTGGGVWVWNSVRFYLYNSIVAGNKTTGDVDDDLMPGICPSFPPVDFGFSNIVGDAATAGCLVNGVNNNQVGVDPLLGPLQDNGGMSPTHEPGPLSPAIDAADPALALDGTGYPLTGNALVYDQRGAGFSRFAGPGSLVDIGAAEFTPTLFVVTTLNDEDDGALDLGDGNSLRELINEVNVTTGPTAIIFDAGLAGQTMTLNGTQLPVISNHLIVNGLGPTQLTLNGNFTSRILEISTDVTVEISDMTLTGASSSAVYNAGRIKITNAVFDQNISTQNGGAIFNLGNARIENSTFTGNWGQEGGAIYNASGSTRSMDVLNSTFFENAARFDGGAIHNHDLSIIRVRNSTISGNRADRTNSNLGDGGGGMHRGVNSFVTLYNTIIAGNFRGSGTIANDFYSQPVYASSAYNIIGVDTGFGSLQEELGNQVGTAASPIDPKLESLADNGGETSTMALLPGSPALDKGNPATVGTGGSTCEPLDQRGDPRIGLCDVGAYELPDTDSDLDGIADEIDNCPAEVNMLQSDSDEDLVGDVCDVCPHDATDSCDPNESESREITPEDGGTITTDDGLTLDLDPGDVGETTTITITNADPVDPAIDLTFGGLPGSGDSVAAYDFQPDGLTFEGPVLLTIVTDVSSLNLMQRDNLDLYRDDGTGTFEALGADCNWVEDPALTYTATCSVFITHFSVYALVAPTDTDGDGVPDLFNGSKDNCPLDPNPDQEDICGAETIFANGFESDQ